jgi:hypothetical protein
VSCICRASRIDAPDGINVDAVLKAVLRLARKHEVHRLANRQPKNTKLRCLLQFIIVDAKSADLPVSRPVIWV